MDFLSIDPRSTTPQDFPEKGSAEEHILFFLTFAVRAPSTHNTQPWKYKIEGGVLKVYGDDARKLPYGDPDDHYFYISLGALAESFVIAAKNFGYHTSVRGGSDALVEVELLGNATADQGDPLFRALCVRRNPRGEFTSTAVPEGVLQDAQREAEALGESVVCTPVSEKELISHVAKETGKGVANAHNDPHFRKEMSKWMKNSVFPGKEGIPGFTLGMPTVLSFIIPTAIRHINMGAKLSQKSEAAVGSAPALFLFGTHDVSPYGFVTLGRAIERSMLSLQANGYSTSIFVGAIEGGNLAIPSDVHNAPVHFIFASGTLKNPQEPWRFAPRHNIQDKMYL